MRMQRILAVLAVALLAAGAAADPKEASVEGTFDVTTFGAQGDGATDDTAAIQRALDAAAKAGGVVRVPGGRWRVAGSLHVPPGVTLQGVAEAPVWADPLVGSVILATGGRGKLDGPALFELGSSSAVRGVVVYYPDQKPKDIQPYPWTFHLQGNDNTVENVTLINSYAGIRIGPEGNVRHRIRSVVGCVLRYGIFVDATSDIGRIEDVQWHCHWWSVPSVGGDWGPVHDYMTKHLEAFVFGRTDWEYVTNTFVYPVCIGYHFIQTKAGACNGQFCGIGADEAQRCVVVEHIQPMGLLITNGQFVAMHGDVKTEVVVESTCSGSVRLVNCAFWGPARQCVVAHGGYVSLNDCYLSASGREKNPGNALVEADGGKLQVRGCTFATDEPSVLLKKGLRSAIVAENNGVRGVDIVNEIGRDAILSANEPWQEAAK